MDNKIKLIFKDGDVEEKIDEKGETIFVCTTKNHVPIGGFPQKNEDLQSFIERRIVEGKAKTFLVINKPTNENNPNRQKND